MTENPIHIVMLEMTQVGVFNGVTRCIQTLSNALCRNKHVRVTWLRIIYGSGYQEQLCHAPVSFHVFRLSISLGSFLTDAPERATCWNLVFNMLSSQFQSQQRVLYHIHTLNLIELATFLRERYSGKIVVLQCCRILLRSELLYNYHIFLIYSCEEVLHGLAQIAPNAL